MNLRNIEEDRENNNYNTIEHNYSYNLCILYSCIFILYFVLTVPTLFMDIILGFIYKNNCYSNQPINILTINNWLIINGILYYINLLILILLNRVYTENSFFRKLLKYSGYLITIFILIFSILGITIFFKYYYKTEKCCLFFYNYILIRISLSPLIIILRFIEIYIA